MRKSAQACFQSADSYLNVRKQSCKRSAINCHCPVRTLAALAALRIGIVPTFFLKYGVIRHHTVYISARYKKTVFRLSELFKIIIGNRLCDYSDIATAAFKHTGYYSYTERRVIDICITCYADEVKLIYSPVFHILF